MALKARFPDNLPSWKVEYVDTRLFLALSITITALTIPPVIARIWMRRITSSRYLIEDYLVFSAFFLQISLFIVDLFVIFYGAAGRPQTEVPHETVVASLKMLVAQGLTYGSLMGCSKMSILFLYKRIFSTKEFRLATHVGMFVVMGYALWAILAVFALCVPVRANWDEVPDAKCGDRTLALTMVGVLDTISDGYILILPLPVVFKLKISTLKKLSLLAIFGIGLFSLAISICRTYFASRIVLANFTQSRALLDILTILEGGSSVIVASTLGLGPLLQKVSCCGMRGSRSGGSRRYINTFIARQAEKRKASSANTDSPADPVLLDCELDNRDHASIGNTSTLHEMHQMTTDCQGGMNETYRGSPQDLAALEDTLSSVAGTNGARGGIMVKREIFVEEENHF